MSPTVKLRNTTRHERRSYRELDTDSETSEVDVKQPTRQQPTRRSRLTYAESSDGNISDPSTPRDISSDEVKVANIGPSCSRTRLAHSAKLLSLTKHRTAKEPSTSSLHEQRARRQKRRIAYTEISSDDDTTASIIPHPPTRTRLQHRRQPSSSSEPPFTEKIQDPAASYRRERSRASLGKGSLPTASSQRIKFPTTKRQKLSHDIFKGSVQVLIPTSGRIPPWQTLPWNVLTQIMKFAAHPLYIGASKDTGSMRWLLNTSEVCKSFHDACIRALMLDPPLFPAYRAQYVMSLLKASEYHFDGPRTEAETTSTRGSIPAKPSVDYRKRIRTLSIEVRDTLARKAGIDFSTVIKYTPLLKNLRFYHNYDSLSDTFIWAVPEGDRGKVKWTYNTERVFESLDDNEIILDSFEWNGRFLRDDPELNLFLSHSQLSQSLKQLSSLTLRNISLPGADKLHDHVKGESIVSSVYESDEKALKLVLWRSKILTVVKSLSELRQLTLHSCNVIDDDVTAQLPNNLVTLELANLPFVRSEGLASYLRRGQSSLTHLRLNGNQSLSLEFMDTISVDAPNLANLEIDMTYHDPTSYRDTEPLFDDLLSLEPPTWPKALQSISISPLRNLTAQDAEVFFQSLVNAQPELPHLRVLTLRAFLKTASWRDRAVLRSKWEALLNQVFNIKYNESVHAPTATNPKTGRQIRSGVSSSQLPLEAATGNGRCHIVEFELSDQRPAQEQFKESDFLDSEPEGDGEWNASADAIEAPRYSSRKYAW